MKRRGVLPDTELKLLIDAGFLTGLDKDRHFGSTSVDLPISDEVYRISGAFLPDPKISIRKQLEPLKICRSPYELKFPLEPGVTFAVKVGADIKLPNTLYGYSNQTSTCARCDIRARLIADGVRRFDSVPNNFSGELWLLVNSRSFPLGLSVGDCLVQLRIFDFDTRLDQTEMSIEYTANNFLWGANGFPIAFGDQPVSDKDGSIIMTVDLKMGNVVAWRTRPLGHSPALIYNAKGLDPKDFYEPLEIMKNGVLIFEGDRLYICSTYERIKVPPLFAAEMNEMDSRSGDFRAHFAGFIEAGFGNCRNGEIPPETLTLEIRSMDKLLMHHGQPICKIKYERVRSEPEVVYGEKKKGSYIGQSGTKVLPKQFHPIPVVV